MSDDAGQTDASRRLDESRLPTRSTLAAMACAGAAALGLVWWLSPGTVVEPPAPIESIPSPAVPEPETRSLASSPPLPLPPSAPAVANAVANAIALTRLPLRLLLTVARTHRSQSFARIEDLRHGDIQILREGQALANRPDVTLHEIEPASVLLENAGVIERLMLEPDGVRLSDRSRRGEPPVVEITPEQREQRRDLSRRLQQRRDAGAEYEAITEVGGLLAEANMQPVFDEDGALVGVELSDIEPDGVLDASGLGEGDVVRSVNGLTWSDPELALELATSIATSEPVEVEVEHSDGGEEVLEVSTLDLLEAEFEAMEEAGEDVPSAEDLARLREALENAGEIPPPGPEAVRHSMESDDPDPHPPQSP